MVIRPSSLVIRQLRVGVEGKEGKLNPRSKNFEQRTSNFVQRKKAKVLQT